VGLADWGVIRPFKAASCGGGNRVIPAMVVMLGPIPLLVCRAVLRSGFGEKRIKKIRGFLENTSKTFTSRL
jgi:hypothetical protein